MIQIQTLLGQPEEEHLLLGTAQVVLVEKLRWLLVGLWQLQHFDHRSYGGWP